MISDLAMRLRLNGYATVPLVPAESEGLALLNGGGRP
jgi:hypothetical protein